MKRAVFLYNPSSGDHSIPSKLNHILGRFQAEEILLQPFRIDGYCEETLIEVLRSSDFNFAVVSGGDGTLNHIANIVLKNAIPLPLGIIPGGTCNDFARSLNIPSNIDGCLDIILRGQISDVDVGLINDESYFIGTCAGGLFVEASFTTDSELKRNFGPFAYYLKALSEVGNIRSFKIKIRSEKEIVEVKAILFLILNGKNAGGFNEVLKEADISDGMMDIVIIKNCSHIDLASLFFKVLSRDSINNRNVQILRTSQCEIEASENISLSVDGEKGPPLPIKVKFVNKTLRVFVP